MSVNYRHLLSFFFSSKDLETFLWLEQSGLKCCMLQMTWVQTCQKGYVSATSNLAGHVCLHRCKLNVNPLWSVQALIIMSVSQWAAFDLPLHFWMPHHATTLPWKCWRCTTSFWELQFITNGALGSSSVVCTLCLWGEAQGLLCLVRIKIHLLRQFATNETFPSFPHPDLVRVGNACSQRAVVQLGALSSISRGQIKEETALRLYQTWKEIMRQLLGKET